MGIASNVVDGPISWRAVPADPLGAEENGSFSAASSEKMDPEIERSGNGLARALKTSYCRPRAISRSMQASTA